MMRIKRSLLFYGGALCTAALWAWWAFSATEKVDVAKGVVILDAKPKDLTRLTLSAEKKTVEITPRAGDGFTLMVSETVEKPDTSKLPAVEPKGEAPKPAPDGGAASGEPPPPPEPPPMITETQVNRYRANKQLVDSLDKLLPFRVERSLGKLDPATLTKVGLEKPARTLTIEVGGQKLAFQLGTETFGATSTYLRQADGEVLLVASSLLRPFDLKSPQYMERNLIDFQAKDIDRIAVLPDEGKRSEEFVRREEGGKNLWSKADSPEDAGGLVGNWIDKVFRMRAAEYLLEDVTPPPKDVAKIQFVKGDKVLDEIRLALQEATEGKKDFFARSTHTGDWVRLNRIEAEGVVTDLPNVIGK